MTPGPAGDASRATSDTVQDTAVWLRILRYLLPHRLVTAGLILAILVEVATDVLFSLGIKLLIDTAVAEREDTLLLAVIVGLGGIFAVTVVTGIAREHLSAVLGARVMWDLRARIFTHLQRLSASFYARHEVGDLMARFSSDLAVVENALVGALPLGVYGALGVVASAAFLFVLDWRLALVTMAVLPVSIVGPHIFGRRATRAGFRRKEIEGRVASTAQETISGQQVIRAFGLESVAWKWFERDISLLADSSRHATFMERLVARTTSLGVILGQIAIISVGAFLVFRDLMSVGTLVGFASLLINLGGMVNKLAQAMPDWLRATGGMRRAGEVLDANPQVRDAEGAPPLPRLSREIRLENVRFSYTGERQDLRGVSLVIPAGATAAFVGRSGSGKSTLFNLLMRFYEPDSGTVSVDGHDLRLVTQESLRSQMGVVFQESFLFRGTVRDNIRLGRPDATDLEVEQAAGSAQIHDLVVSWPRGYDTDVGERGSRLSGGQRQRVALARAILRDPAILLLDEATSALDPATEAAFNATLRDIARGRTVVSVTHRLSGVVAADHIFVMDQGQLVEHGTHRELVARAGVYADLWRQQQEGLAISADGRSADVTAARLRAMPLFAQLAEPLLQELAERFSSERLPEGRVVFEEGDAGDKLYIVAHGSVEVLRSDGPGAPRRLAVLQDGDVFGEMALLNDVPRTATVRTRTPCILLTLSSRQFSQLLQSSPEVRASIQGLAASRAQEQQTAATAGGPLPI